MNEILCRLNFFIIQNRNRLKKSNHEARLNGEGIWWTVAAVLGRASLLSSSILLAKTYTTSSYRWATQNTGDSYSIGVRIHPQLDFHLEWGEPPALCKSRRRNHGVWSHWKVGPVNCSPSKNLLIDHKSTFACMVKVVKASTWKQTRF